MIRHMKYVYAVYKYKSFSKAAQALYISQPSLSTTVKRVEEEVGAPLFNRGANPITLTEAGQFYIDSIEEVMKIENRMKAHFAEMKDHQGALKIGSSSFFCTYVLPDLVARFEELHPDQRVITYEYNTDDLAEHLQSGSVDLNISVDNMEQRYFNRIFWRRENLILAVPADYPENDLCREYQLTWEQVEAGELTAVPEVPLRIFEHCPFLFLKERSDMYWRGLEMCRLAGFRPNVRMYLDQMNSSYYLAKEGRGIIFLRAQSLNHLEKNNCLKFYRLNSALSRREIYLYSKEGERLSPQAELFIEFLMNEQDDRLASGHGDCE